ncbi:phage integrase SAM-like domain-containing protein, partial [Vibrio anguillarum]
KGGNGSNVNFTRFYGKGFDDITSRVYYTAKALLKNTDALSEETQKTYFTNGFSHFAEYLTLFRYSAGEDLTQDDITPELIEQYLLHLRGCELGYNTQKGYYTHLKSMLIYMRNKGYWSVIGDINLNNDFFPKNPFPNSSKRAKGEKSLTPHEKRQVVVALKQAIKPIYQKTEPLTGYELVVCLLAVAIQTGINTSPLLDMTTDSLTDHPLKDCRKLLTVFKKRGNATQ